MFSFKTNWALILHKNDSHIVSTPQNIIATILPDWLCYSCVTLCSFRETDFGTPYIGFGAPSCEWTTWKLYSLSKCAKVNYWCAKIISLLPIILYHSNWWKIYWFLRYQIIIYSFFRMNVLLNIPRYTWLKFMDQWSTLTTGKELSTVIKRTYQPHRRKRPQTFKLSE